MLRRSRGSRRDRRGLLQFGHSKDDPTRPQIKVMIGSLDPLGMPLATDVLSGEHADDGLYIPLIERIVSGSIDLVSSWLAIAK